MQMRSLLGALASPFACMSTQLLLIILLSLILPKCLLQKLYQESGKVLLGVRILKKGLAAQEDILRLVSPAQFAAVC